jgi:hypothetical protein
MEPLDLSFLQGLGQPEQKKRKRGGLAGIWDRNKNVIKPLATIGAGLVPGLGPLASAAIGGLMGGLDRPGKGGVGFDVGAGARGAVQGYGMGQLGQAGASLLGRGAGQAVAAGTTPTPATGGMVADPSRGGMVPIGGPSPDYTPGGMPGGTSRLREIAQGLDRGIGRGLQRGLAFAKANPEAVGMGLQALSGVMGTQEMRRLRQQELDEERRRAETLARFALPLYMQSMGGR